MSAAPETAPPTVRTVFEYAPWIVCPLSAQVLGRPVPMPPPAPLPFPEEHQPPEGTPVNRADDRGQLLLFNPED